MRKWIIRKLLKKLNDNGKLELADEMISDVLHSKKGSISNIVAERLITSIIKSSGNKIVSFILKD